VETTFTLQTVVDGLRSTGDDFGTRDAPSLIFAPFLRCYKAAAQGAAATQAIFLLAIVIRDFFFNRPVASAREKSHV